MSADSLWFCSDEDARPEWFWVARRLMKANGGMLGRECAIIERPSTWLWWLHDLLRPSYAPPRIG